MATRTFLIWALGLLVLVTGLFCMVAMAQQGPQGASTLGLRMTAARQFTTWLPTAAVQERRTLDAMSLTRPAGMSN